MTSTARAVPATHGILHPVVGLATFALERLAPSASLAPLVESFWSVRWRLAAPHVQETLPFPALNLAFECGPDGRCAANLHGIPRRRFQRRLEGEGAVLGVKLRAGAFHLLSGRAAVVLDDRIVAARAFFGVGVDDLARTFDARDEPHVAARVAAVEAWLAALPAAQRALERASHDATFALVGRAMALAHDDRELLRADELAARLDVGLRSLQRTFRVWVGVSPKWVLARFRLHEAAEHMARESPRLAELAAELGYVDQGHFARDFARHVGHTPARYAAAQAAARRRAASLAPAPR